MSIIKRHITPAVEPQRIIGVYATSCHWATLRRLQSPGTMGSQVPDFTTEPEGMLTVGPDARLEPDPQPDSTTLTSRTPTREAVQARQRIRRSFKRGATGTSFDSGSV